MAHSSALLQAQRFLMNNSTKITREIMLYISNRKIETRLCAANCQLFSGELFRIQRSAQNALCSDWNHCATQYCFHFTPNLWPFVKIFQYVFLSYGSQNRKTKISHLTYQQSDVVYVFFVFAAKKMMYYKKGRAQWAIPFSRLDAQEQLFVLVAITVKYSKTSLKSFSRI